MGIAIDPADNGIYWVDLSAALRQNEVDTKLLVPRDNRLDDNDGLRRFRKYCSSMTQSGHAILDIVSSDADRQADGAFVCYHVGREDGRALVLLRRLLFTLHPDAFPYAAHQLAHAIPHPDIFHTSESMASQEARRVLRASLDWSPTEARKLLTLVDDENGFGRGSMGQSVFHLLIEGSDHVDVIRQATVEAARAGDERVAAWGLVLAVYLAGEGGATEMEDLVQAAPELANVWSASEVAQQLADHGSISLW